MTTGLEITTPTDTTIVLTRSFKAPRRLVWEAMTSPDKMKRWMLPPPGWTLNVCEVEPRLGGTLKVALGRQSLHASKSGKCRSFPAVPACFTAQMMSGINGVWRRPIWRLYEPLIPQQGAGC